jgi:50S ribosomal protein L16 3-hydroxylase
LNKLNLFKNSAVNESTFLEKYWHKKPLLIRGAVALEDLSVLPTKAQLQQLSYHEDIQSRIVFKNSEHEYTVEYGPFVAEDFNGLTNKCWNLLVSDIDKWQPISRNILKYFNFMRHWIFDDIMVSCGSKDGTVGPHTDHYDVFLLQVHGQRQWGYTHTQILNPGLMPEQALKLMDDFNADKTHILNPGDVLYLPPEVAHYGIAENDDCVTCSVGMRTPSHAELITSFVDNIAQTLSANNRFEEPQFSIQPHKGEITKKDIEEIFQILTNNIHIDKSYISQWFGEYISEYRSMFYEFNQYQEVAELNKSKDLLLSPFSKSCYFKASKNVNLFINGQSFVSSLELAQMICDEQIVSSQTLNTLSKSDIKVIEQAFENGSLIQK